MRVALLFALLLTIAPAARAAEVLPTQPLRTSSVQLPMAAESPTSAEPEARVRAQEAQRTDSGDARSRGDFPARGSFWWYVGIIVVAGIILAVVN